MTGSGEDARGRKAALREDLLARRRSLPEAHRQQATEQVWERVRELPEWREARCVGFYVSTGAEVGTRKALREELDAAAHHVAAPVTNPDAAGLTFREVRSFDDLVPGAFDILEPADGEAVDAADLDFVLVPGVGFDAAGRRLGRGGGHYDAFLAGYGGTAVGLAFSEQVVETVPVDAHDEPVDLVVTPRHVHRGGRRVE